MAELQTKVARPLSPHLQIFRPLMTMMMSIVHRITGSGLYVGTAFFAWYLVAAASGPEAFATASWFFGSILGQLILFAYTWVWIHHALGGIRHFIWDTGHGYGVEARNWLAKATLVGSVSITILIWIVALIVR